jgi:phosphonate transport system substrate-binding protein
LLVLALVLALSAQLVAVAAQGDLGSDSNPIKVYFVPSVDAAVITTGGEVMKAALEEATGLKFEVSVPASYAATIEEMCANPGASMGFIPALGYVLASERCGVEVAAKAVRFGWAVYWTEYIVRRDSEIYTFGDLAGKTWGYGEPSSTSGYAVPLTEMKAAGIEPGDSKETGGHNQTVLAVYNGEVDFGTTFFSPLLVPEGHAPWSIGDAPEPWDPSETSFVSEDGSKLMVGDFRVLDARANVRDTAPDIIEKVRILRISQAIPNDTLSFGPDFPVELRQQIMDALVAFSQTEAWASSIGSTDFYGWTSITPAEDAEYDIVRDMVANVPALADRYK